MIRTVLAGRRGRWSALLLGGGCALTIAEGVPSKRQARRLAARFEKAFAELPPRARTNLLAAIMEAVDDQMAVVPQEPR